MKTKHLLSVLLLAGCYRPDLNVNFEISQGDAPMGYQFRLQTRQKVRLRKLIIEQGVSSDLPAELPASQDHTLPLLGLYPGRTHQVRVLYEDEQGQARETPSRSLTTPPLPANFPQLRLQRTSPQASPGYLLFSVALQAGGGKMPRDSYLILCDLQARPIWYMPFQAMLGEVKADSHGLWVQSSTGLSISQLDWSGKTRKIWQADGLRPANGPALAVKTDTFHHDFVSDGSGGFWTLGTKLSPPGQLRVVDDLILHLDAAGTIRKSIPLRPMDPRRRVYDKEFNFWAAFYGPLVEAWGHANSLALDARGKLALVSLRLQDAVVQIDLDTGQPRWILASPEKWNERCRKLLLKPVGRLRWPARQHAASWLKNGNLILFDNGRTASRAVEFQVDPIRFTVSQTWEFTDHPPFYSTLLGDVDELSNGNLQIVDGWRRGEQNHVWARILEVTHRPTPEKVLEIEVDTPGGPGCSIYRCQRLTTLY